MVIPIDAVRSGMGFDAAGHWHKARAGFMPARLREGDEDPLAFARSAMYGLLIGAALWIGLIVALTGLLSLL